MQIKIFGNYDLNKVTAEANDFAHEYMSQVGEVKIYDMRLSINPDSTRYFISVTYE